MRLSSVRARLTLWNVGVLALVLVGFGLALCSVVQVRLSAALDDQLRDRMRGFQNRPPRGPGGPGFGLGRGGPREPFPPGEPGRPAAEPFFPPEGPGPWGQPAGLPEPPLPEPPPGPDFLRPRVLDLSGRPLSPRSEDEPWDPAAVALSGRGAQVLSTVRREDGELRVISAPLRSREGELLGVVQMAHSLSEQQRLVNGLVWTLWMLVPVALLIAGVGGAFLTGRAIQPVRAATRAAAEIGAEDLSRRLVVKGDDEFAELARTFNGMIERLEQAFTRLETAYEQQRRFTGDASHELRTPLTTIKANTSLVLSHGETMEDYRVAVEAADRAADVMNRIVQDLLLLARSDAGQLRIERAPVAAEEIVRRALDLLPKDAAVRVRVSLARDLPPASGDVHHLTRLLLNLVENAVRHTPPEGTVEVAAHAGGDYLLLHVRDTGEGIPAEHLPHLTERFYRVDKARARAHGGTGLGLAICRSILDAHHGDMQIESREGVGTTVTVRLPLIR